MTGQQIAVVAAKKNFPLSVTRHLVKRRAAAVIRNFVPGWPAGFYFVTLNKHSLVTSSRQLQRDIAFFTKTLQRTSD